MLSSIGKKNYFVVKLQNSMQKSQEIENICSINISCHIPVAPLSNQQINNFPLSILW